jgi:asparagine synthase (glutamine-hydrolysing)
MKINLLMKNWHGWKCYKFEKYNAWFSGYILNTNTGVFFNNAIALMDNDNSSYYDFDKLARSIQGNFSFVVANKSKLFCSVDRIRSIPLFYNLNDGEINITNHPPYMVKSIGLDCAGYDRESVLEISMSGYTIGNKTLCPSLLQLCSGELLVVKHRDVKLREYYHYSPWKVKDRSKLLLKKELTEVSRQVLADMVKNINGRQIVVPLSAGNDSRFIASGLKELGVKNVFCFSYGINNNFEVRTAEKVAKHLGYPWTYIPLSIASQKKTFSKRDFNDFWEYTDTFSNAPVLIDYSAVKTLKESSKISKEAIFVNGNSGDFITGGHIVPDIQLDSNTRIDGLINYIITKHYSLWDCLKTKDNIDKIKNEIKNEIKNLMSNYNLTESSFAEIGESIEWRGRQSKVVTATQRSYEFHGYEWRLPLWDPVYMDFWEGVEKKYKINQSLYIETLLENNWGGVWGNITVNDFSIASNRLRLFRNLTKLFFLFFEKEAWHQFDKKFFSYFYDDTAATAIVPYNKVIFNRCGARNRNSWITKKYLNKYKI